MWQGQGLPAPRTMYRRSSRTISHVPGIPVFDGHNDALTREDHARLGDGRDGGHLDLPRMRAGGIRGGIFAVFSWSGDDHHDEPLARDDGVLEFPFPEPLDHSAAAAHATAAAGRLLALERQGLVRVARSIADLSAARENSGPPAAVLALEGAEAIDPDLE